VSEDPWDDDKVEGQTKPSYALRYFRRNAITLKLHDVTSLNVIRYIVLVRIELCIFAPFKMSSGPPAKRLKQLVLKFDVTPQRSLQQQEAVQNETRPDATSIKYPS